MLKWLQLPHQAAAATKGVQAQGLPVVWLHFSFARAESPTLWPPAEEETQVAEDSRATSQTVPSWAC